MRESDEEGPKGEREGEREGGTEPEERKSFHQPTTKDYFLYYTGW